MRRARPSGSRPCCTVSRTSSGSPSTCWPGSGPTTTGQVTFAGGAVRNRWWNQLRADLLQRPVLHARAASRRPPGRPWWPPPTAGELAATASAMVRIASGSSPTSQRGERLLERLRAAGERAGRARLAGEAPDHTPRRWVHEPRDAAPAARAEPVPPRPDAVAHREPLRRVQRHRAHLGRRGAGRPRWPPGRPPPARRRRLLADAPLPRDRRGGSERAQRRARWSSTTCARCTSASPRAARSTRSTPSTPAPSTPSVPTRCTRLCRLGAARRRGPPGCGGPARTCRRQPGCAPAGRRPQHSAPAGAVPAAGHRAVALPPGVPPHRQRRTDTTAHRNRRPGPPWAARAQSPAPPHDGGLVMTGPDIWTPSRAKGMSRRDLLRADGAGQCGDGRARAARRLRRRHRRPASEETGPTR